MPDPVKMVDGAMLSSYYLAGIVNGLNRFRTCWQPCRDTQETGLAELFQKVASSIGADRGMASHICPFPVNQKIQDTGTEQLPSNLGPPESAVFDLLAESKQHMIGWLSSDVSLRNQGPKDPLIALRML